MKKNIFEGAKFGDKFWTANEPDNEFPNGRMAIFTRFAEDIVTHDVSAILYLDDSFAEIWCTLDGRYFDYIGKEKKFWDDIPSPYIIGRYKEPINEKKLDNLRYDYMQTIPIKELEENPYCVCSEAFVAGYRKAMEE